MVNTRKVLYYSRVVGAHPVHHNDPVCRIGGQNSIWDIRLGDDGRPLCDECAVMGSAEDLVSLAVIRDPTSLFAHDRIACQSQIGTPEIAHRLLGQPRRQFPR
jgi:hypothetical protein